MKSIIMYYYGMKDISIEKTENEIFIIEDNKKYRLSIVDKSLESILSYVQEDKRFNNVVKGKNKKNTMELNNNKYILEQIEVTNDIEHIYREQKIISKINDGKAWIELWKRKIEQLEKNKSKLKGSNLEYLYSYYIGMAENAIQILNTVEEKQYDLVICHKRYGEQKNNYINNAVLDYKEREIANIISFLYNNDKLELDKYISKLKNANKKLIIARLMFPIDYFDRVDKYILKEEAEKIVGNVKENEKLIKKLIKQFNIEDNEITWIKKES